MNNQPANTQPAPQQSGDGSNSVVMVLLFIVVAIIIAAGVYFLMGRNEPVQNTGPDITIPDEIDINTNFPSGDDTGGTMDEGGSGDAGTGNGE